MIDVGTFVVKDSLSATFGKMSDAALKFDKTLNSFKGTKKLSDSLDSLSKEALRPMRELAKEKARVAKEAAKEQRALEAAAKAFAASEKKRQAEIEKTRKMQEKAAASTTWSRMKGAFGEAVSPKQMAIGAARSIGERAVSMPFNVLSAGLGMLETIGDKVFDVGKDLVSSVIEAAQFKQNAITGLEYMLGTRKEAEQIFADAQKLAQDTPLDTDKVITGIKQLVTAGFSGKDSMMLFKAVADQAAKFADDEGMQDKVIAAFSRVQGRGVATAEDLESFRVAGFRAKGIIEELKGKKNLAPLFKGIKADASEEDLIKQVKTVLGKGQIGSTTFLNAAIASLEKGKGDIGSFANEMGAKSLTGTISNFKAGFKDLLKSVNIQDWAGVKQFQDFLTRITKMLQGDAGKGLLKTVENIFNALMSGLDRIQSSDMDDWLAKLTTFGNEAVAVIEKAWTWFDRLMHGDVNVGDDLGDVLIDMGAYIGEGVLKGMKEGATGLGSGEKKFISKYGFGSEDARVFASEKGFRGDAEYKDFLAQYEQLLPKFYAAGAAGEIDTTNKGGVDLLEKVWKFAQTADVIERNMRETADRQALMDALDTGQYGAGKGGGGYGDLNIPKFGDGAMVTSPTLAWVGESGPEAVVPLRTMAGDGYTSLPTSGRGGRGGLGGVNVSLSIGSITGMGDPTQAANTIADITVERVVLALLERKAAEG